MRSRTTEPTKSPKRPIPPSSTTPSVGVELVATSITSTGNGDEGANSGVLAENPHLKYYKNRRGYVRTTFTAQELRTDFRILPYVRTPDAPVSTAASFVTEDHVRALHPA